MARTPTDESTSTPGREPASAPRDLRQYAHVAYDGHPMYLQIHRRKDDKPNEPDPCRTSANTDTEVVPNAIPNHCNRATEAVPNEIPNDFNTATKAVLNEIRNYCDMATELVPNEIEYDHRTY